MELIYSICKITLGKKEEEESLFADSDVACDAITSQCSVRSIQSIDSVIDHLDFALVLL